MRDIKKYSSVYVKDEFEKILVKYRRKKVLEIMDQYQPKTIIEIGCGMEPLFEYLNVNYVEYCCVDPSSLFCENANRKKATMGKNIKVIQNFFEQCVDLFANKHWDMIIVSSLLHEVEDPLLLLSDIKKVCDCNTIVHFNVPNLNSFHMLFALQAGIIANLGGISEKGKEWQRTTTFSQNSLADMLNMAGFEIVDQGSYFIKLFNHEKMFRAIEYGLLDEQLLDGLYKLSDILPEIGAEIYANVRLK